MILGLRDRRLPGPGECDAEPATPEIRAHRAKEGRFVIDHEDMRAGWLFHRVPASAAVRAGKASGNVNRNVAPPSARFAAVMRPPCASTRPRAIARPSPTPPG